MNKLRTAMRHVGAKNVLCARSMEVELKRPKLKDLIREFKIPKSGKCEGVFEVSTFLLPCLECTSGHAHVSPVNHCAK